MLHSEELYTPRPIEMIGRRMDILKIKGAIAERKATTEVFHIIGLAGLGKTRLLEEVERFQEEQQTILFLVTKIIDLYHTEYQSTAGLRHGIVDSLDPQKQHFTQYHLLYQTLQEKKQQPDISSDEIAQIDAELDRLFQKEYETLAQKARLVLRFDTLELVQYENDVVQAMQAYILSVRLKLEELDAMKH
jgi:hypothetical protein